MLAASIDSPETVPSIPGYLKKNGLHCRVLLAGENGVPGYDFSAASSLFVIDRKGFLAGVPSEFYMRFREELERRLPDLVAGRPTLGPVLWAAQRLPPGWGEIWRDPRASGAYSLTAAPATPKGSLEIGLLDGAHHFMRYSPQGVLLGEVTLEDRGEAWWGLQGADLDGDGMNEWIVRSGSEVILIDSEGRPYWTYYGIDADQANVEVAGVTDVDGDGFKEIVVRAGNTVTALRSLKQPQWTHRSRESLIHAAMDAQGGIWAQSERGLFPIDAHGRAGSPVTPAFGAMQLKGETVGRGGEPLRIFGGRNTRFVDADHDLDGDGRKDVVVAGGPGGVSAYDAEGRTILSLTIAENQIAPQIALANLDGRPGDEMILYVPQYGLVALGKQGDGAVGQGAP